MKSPTDFLVITNRSTSNPEAMLIHLREQWETAVQEILRENGYEFAWITKGDIFELRYNGPTPSSEEFARYCREAVVRTKQGEVYE